MGKIILPYFHAPSVELRVDGLCATRLSSHDAEKLGKEMDFLVRMRDTDHLMLDTQGNIRSTFYWPLLVVPDELPRNYYDSLVHLLTGRWRYEIAVAAGKSPASPKILRFTRKLLRDLARGAKLIKNEKRFQIALERWGAGYARHDPIDSVLDCCSSLEAAFRLGDELRLRLSLATYHTLQKRKRAGFRTVYEMYKVRSEFVHGSKVPVVREQERINYVHTVSQVLLTLLRTGYLPKPEMLSKQIEGQYQ